MNCHTFQVEKIDIEGKQVMFSFPWLINEKLSTGGTFELPDEFPTLLNNHRIDPSYPPGLLSEQAGKKVMEIIDNEGSHWLE